MTTRYGFTIYLICRNPACKERIFPLEVAPNEPFHSFYSAKTYIEALQGGTLQELLSNERTDRLLINQIATIANREKIPELATCRCCGCVGLLADHQYLILHLHECVER